MRLHKEGRTILFIALVVLFGLNWAVMYYYPASAAVQNIAIVVSLLFYVLILQFFRSPVFAITKNDKQILAPADGKVVVIEDTDEDEYLKSKRKQISIFMSPLNVHV